ncbi:hypothetical protein EB796_018977 [Bugula neritina]|uniref:Uncharacterized protein n=1 Tax=Bugula neritina TaxID=10212 RepID=A0A7J7JAP7_BUGNE|nr:hypothetical protein EB796_018977 [Bugula neritina]
MLDGTSPAVYDLAVYYWLISFCITMYGNLGAAALTTHLDNDITDLRCPRYAAWQKVELLKHPAVSPEYHRDQDRRILSQRSR